LQILDKSRYCKTRFNHDLRIRNLHERNMYEKSEKEGLIVEHELEEVERDYIEFRKEIGEE